MLLDSTTNRYNIPPLHDLGVIVWLQGVTPTARWTAARKEEWEGALTLLKTTQAVLLQLITARLITAQQTPKWNKMKPNPQERSFSTADSNFGAHVNFRCYILIHSCFTEPATQFFQCQSLLKTFFFNCLSTFRLSRGDSWGHGSFSLGDWVNHGGVRDPEAAAAEAPLQGPSRLTAEKLW